MEKDHSQKFSEEKRKQLQSEIQSDMTILAKLAPSLHENPAVVRHVEMAERGGEKGVSANHERKLGALAMTLAEITERGGERYTKLLFSRAIEALIIKPEDIPEAYWEQQKQLMRDNGYGDVDLSNERKQELTNELQSAQRTGLESWSSYLQHEVKNYPK